MSIYISGNFTTFYFLYSLFNHIAFLRNHGKLTGKKCVKGDSSASILRQLYIYLLRLHLRENFCKRKFIREFPLSY